MSDPIRPEEQRARDAVRSLPEPAARAEFRARLRAEFVEGRIPETAPPRRASVIPFPARVALALAAAAAGVFFILGRTPRWDVMTAPASGEVRIDGRAFPAADVAAWRGELAPGVRVAWTGAEPLALALRERLAVQLMPDAELTLPAAAKGDDAWRLDVERGAMQVSTGPKFAGHRLLVHTVPVDVAVTGTTFAVIRMPDLACVCVLEGTVHLHMPDGRTMPVEEGARRVVHDDGTVDTFGEVAADEVPVLEAFRDEASAFLGGRAPARP